VEAIIQRGTEKAREVAQGTMVEVRNAMHIQVRGCTR